jgi:hypothetical protein
MKMKRILAILLFVIAGQKSFATDWAWYYIYVQTDYIQGPWTRMDVLDKSGSYTYLHPKQFEELFGTESIDLANAIFSHLQKESPKRYTFNSALSLLSDTVVIQVKDSIPDFDAVKNELTASYTLNNFPAVKIVQGGKTDVYTLRDVSVPYMDLIFPAYAETDTLSQKDTVSAISIPEVPIEQEPQSENKIPAWLILSAIINVILIILLLRKVKKEE